MPEARIAGAPTLTAVRILRVLLVAPPDAAREESWALFDANGRVLQRGRSVPGQWPASERREAVLAADAVRVVALALPPLPHDRLIAAATYALEDRLATPVDDAVVAVSEREPDGRIIAIIAARELVDALFAATPPFSKAVAEPELARTVDGWRWCESEAGSFVRTDEGAAFSASRAPHESLPPELVHALAEAARNGRAPANIVVDRPADASTLQRWQQETGIRFVAGKPWRWDAAAPESFAAATDVLAALRRALSTRAEPSARRYAFALTLAGLALGLHLLAAAGTWAWQRTALARAEQALIPVAQEAGARNAVASDAATSIATLHADARHRAGLAAPNDAMPMFARAAPALAALPAGTLRTATWTAGAWTLELAAIDEAALAEFVQRIGAAGLSGLHARTATGVRARVTPSP
jgi:hypothetical protein